MIRRKQFFVLFGFGALALALTGAALAWFFTARPAGPTVETRPSAFDAEDRREGLHCLDPDGGHAGVVRRVKADLAHPDTFRNTGTAIYPLRDGQHFLVMGFRALAKGGHRTNAAIAMTKIDHERCFAGEIEILD